MEHKDGGPAFPATDAHGLNNGMPGMSLRDYFAAKAMQAMFAGSPLTASGNPDLTARGAYQMADAMLKASGE